MDQGTSPYATVSPLRSDEFLIGGGRKRKSEGEPEEKKKSARIISSAYAHLRKGQTVIMNPRREIQYRGDALHLAGLRAEITHLPSDEDGNQQMEVKFIPDLTKDPMLNRHKYHRVYLWYDDVIPLSDLEGGTLYGSG